MPRFALLDADSRVVNLVALARREDFLTEARPTLTGQQGTAGEDLYETVTVETDHHLVQHGAVTLVPDDGTARRGFVFHGGRFAPAAVPSPDAASA